MGNRDDYLLEGVMFGVIVAIIGALYIMEFYQNETIAMICCPLCVLFSAFLGKLMEKKR